MKYAIIGNSTAGIGVVEGIRSIDKKGSIAIFSNEPYHTYSRPLISYLLSGQMTEEKMKYRDASFYDTNQCDFHPGRSVVTIDSDQKKLALDDGRSYTYDKLCVATGSSPFVPPLDGLDSACHVHTFMSLADAKAIQASCDQKRVVIIGAGLIGLKCAEGIAGRVASLTVIDLAPRILSSILDDSGAKIIQRHLQNNGIQFKLSRRVSRVDHHEVILDNQESIPFDLLIMAVGVRPNTQLLKNIAAIDQGIIVNDRSQTTAADVYAAGDCAQAVDVSDGQSRVMPLLPNAYLMGECAGINMAGGDKTFGTAMPMNAIGFFGQHIMTAGHYTGDVYEEIDGNHYKRLFFQDNQLKGYILIGAVEKAGIYTSLIREQTPLETLDFEMICQKPGLIAFAKQDRKAILGGVV